MTPLNLELGLSESVAQAAESGRGGFSIVGGGTRQMQTLYIVGGIVVVILGVVGLVLWLRR